MSYNSGVYEHDDYLEFKPSEMLLKELVEMGFNKNGATRGLFYTGNRSLDMAANWLVENEATFKGINDPIQPGELSYSYYPTTVPLSSATATTVSSGGGLRYGVSTDVRAPMSSNKRYMVLMYYPNDGAAYDAADAEYDAGTHYPVESDRYPQTDYNSSSTFHRYNAGRNPQAGTRRPQPPPSATTNDYQASDSVADSMPRVAGLGREYGTREDAATLASSSLEVCSLFLVVDASLGLKPEEQAKMVARASLKLVLDSHSQFGSASVLNRLKIWARNGEVVKVIDCRDGTKMSRMQDEAVKRRVISTLIKDKEDLQESYSEHNICLALFGPTSVLDQLVQSVRED